MDSYANTVFVTDRIKELGNMVDTWNIITVICFIILLGMCVVFLVKKRKMIKIFIVAFLVLTVASYHYWINLEREYQDEIEQYGYDETYMKSLSYSCRLEPQDNFSYKVIVPAPANDQLNSVIEIINGNGEITHNETIYGNGLEIVFKGEIDIAGEIQQPELIKYKYLSLAEYDDEELFWIYFESHSNSTSNPYITLVLRYSTHFCGFRYTISDELVVGWNKYIPVYTDSVSD